MFKNIGALLFLLLGVQGTWAYDRCDELFSEAVLFSNPQFIRSVNAAYNQELDRVKNFKTSKWVGFALADKLKSPEGSLYRALGYALVKGQKNRDMGLLPRDLFDYFRAYRRIMEQKIAANLVRPDDVIYPGLLLQNKNDRSVVAVSKDDEIPQNLDDWEILATGEVPLKEFYSLLARRIMPFGFSRLYDHEFSHHFTFLREGGESFMTAVVAVAEDVHTGKIDIEDPLVQKRLFWLLEFMDLPDVQEKRLIVDQFAALGLDASVLENFTAHTHFLKSLDDDQLLRHVNVLLQLSSTTLLGWGGAGTDSYNYESYADWTKTVERSLNSESAENLKYDPPNPVFPFEYTRDGNLTYFLRHIEILKYALHPIPVKQFFILPSLYKYSKYKLPKASLTEADREKLKGILVDRMVRVERAFWTAIQLNLSAAAMVQMGARTRIPDDSPLVRYLRSFVTPQTWVYSVFVNP